MSKKNKNKAPKRIAGVKIPKALRKTLRPLAEAVDTPLGRAIVAQAVVNSTAALLFDPRARQRVAAAGLQAGMAGANAWRNMTRMGQGAFEGALRAAPEANTPPADRDGPREGSAPQPTPTGVQGRGARGTPAHAAS